MNNNSIWLIPIFLGLLIGVIVTIFTHKTEKTKKLTKEFVHSVLAESTEPGSEIGPDAWGRQMKYNRIVTPYYVTHIASSAGKDGVFGNDDDIIGTDTDHNVSKMAGNIVANQSKQFGKGLIDGIKTKNKFEEFEEKANKPTTKPSWMPWKR